MQISQILLSNQEKKAIQSQIEVYNWLKKGK